MRVAQRLYEGMELGEIGTVGLITYMRTDSPRVAERGGPSGKGLDQGPVRRILRASQTQCLQEPQGGSGSPRGHPSHLDGIDP